MNLENEATTRVLKARSALILARRFYGVLVSNVEPVISSKVPTAATNGKQHFWNPDYVSTLTADELEAVQAHETEHDARHHGTRRGQRDPRKWNEACDYAINPDLLAEGFKLPKGVLFEERFRGMSAEDIYRTRELDEQRKQEPEPQPEPDPQEPQEEGEDESEGQQQEPEAQDGQEQGEEPGSEPESEEGGQDGPGEPQDGDGEAGDGEGQDGEEGSQEAPDGPGDGPGDEGPAEGSSEGQGEADGSGEGEAAGEGESSPRGSSGDPGMCGEVLDAVGDAADNADLDARWERIKRQAVSLAKSIGQLPGHVSQDIERANNPEQDWREVLRAWFDQGALVTETWSRPNRRLIGGGLYMPGKQRDGINRVAFLIDTSGSMDEIALGLVRNEAQAALDDGAIDEVVVVFGDVVVTRVDTYRTGDEMDFDPRGRGGTDLKPLFKYVADELDDVSLIVCFTDMEIGDPGPEPACPVLFAATGYPEEVRRYLANAPWGAPGIDVGAH